MIGEKDGVQVLKIGNDLVLMITAWPTAYILVLDEQQAVDIAEGLLRGTLTADQTEKVDDILAAMMPKAGKGQPS